VRNAINLFSIGTMEADGAQCLSDSNKCRRPPHLLDHPLLKYKNDAIESSLEVKSLCRGNSGVSSFIRRSCGLDFDIKRVRRCTVHVSSVLKVPRYAAEMLSHNPDHKRNRESQISKNKPLTCIEEAQVSQHHEQAREQGDHGKIAHQQNDIE